MKSDLELRIQKQLTTAFINTDVITLVLHTRVKTLTGVDKGVLKAGPDRRPQQFQLIIQPGGGGQPSFQSGERVDVTESGTRSFTAVLLGAADCEMDLYDWWRTEAGQLMVITRILTDNGFEKKGLVISYDRTK